MSFRIFFLSLSIACGARAGAEEAANTYIVTPADGATVSNPITVVFGLTGGYGIAPAGIVKEHTGHHHLIIDAPLPNLVESIPKDENYRHFGRGQTQAEIELTPGDHTLQLLLGNFAHIPHAPPIMSDPITITVE